MRGATRGTKGASALLALLLSVGCGSVSLPTAPAPPPGPPQPLPPVVDMAGSWTGTVEAANFSPHPITLFVVQNYSCVDGDWRDATGDVKGAISGLASEESFSGQISFERSAAGGGKCIASGNISGKVEGDTIRWTADSLNPSGNCDGGVPQSFVLSVKR